MPYSKDTTQKNCPSCGILLDIVTEWSGDYKANERERAKCPECGDIAASDKCLGITAKVAASADNEGE